MFVLRTILAGTSITQYAVAAVQAIQMIALKSGHVTFHSSVRSSAVLQQCVVYGVRARSQRLSGTLTSIFTYY